MNLKTCLDSLRQEIRTSRSSIPVSDFPFDRAAASDIRTGYVNGLPAKRLVITLRAPGCAWIKKGGGCLMCGHYAGTTKGILPSPDETIEQFVSEVDGYDTSDIEIISLYNSGSMLNPSEMHPVALESIFLKISEMPKIKKVVLETRAEFVDRHIVERFAGILGSERRLSIAMGLETSDDLKRDICINKGCASSYIAEKVKEIRDIADIQLYIFFGLPFLTEKEAIEDTVESLRFAASLCADEIHIEPATIQSYTLISRLHSSGLYSLPSLYSLREVLLRVYPEIRPYISPFMHMPLPVEIPGGCPECTAMLRKAFLEEYNIRRDKESLDIPACPCMEEWRKKLLVNDPRQLETRIADALLKLSRGVA